MSMEGYESILGIDQLALIDMNQSIDDFLKINFSISIPYCTESTFRYKILNSFQSESSSA